jgi:hypothetical protein
MNFSFNNYDTGGFFDEMFDADGKVRPGYDHFKERVEQLSQEEFLRRQQSAERALMAMGITFNVYSENEGTERIMPVDIIPRIVDATEWEKIEKGLIQRITALNLFLNDIYSDQKIIKDGIIPAEVILSSKDFLKACIGIKPAKNIYIGAEAGSVNNKGYRQVVYQGKSYRSHRVIYDMHYGVMPEHIDHKDNNTLNNNINNLRPADKSQNRYNSKINNNNTSGHKNITWHKRKQKWRVQIMVHNKRVYGGAFDDLELAIARASELRDKYHGEFVRHK